MSELTQDRLKELLEYDESTGEFWWKAKKAGANIQGYVVIEIDGKSYRAHRLAWLYTHGEMPNGHIDHHNLNRSDNRMGNLRESTRQQNQANTMRYKNNTSGFKGVHWHKKDKKWHANIRVHLQSKYLGAFDTPEDAAKVYDEAAKQYFGNFARINFA